MCNPSNANTFENLLSIRTSPETKNFKKKYRISCMLKNMYLKAVFGNWAIS